MSIDILTTFIENTPNDLASAWSYKDVTDLASRTLPQNVMGDQEPLLRGDQHRLWLRWFLEGMVSPHLMALDPTIGQLDILEVAMKRINSLYATIDIDRRKKLGEAVASHIYASVKTLRNATQRDFATTATRHALIASSAIPRCYICGYAFSQPAKDAFLKVKGRSHIVLPALIDVFRPHGLVERDEKIEIEHVIPVAA